MKKYLAFGLIVFVTAFLDIYTKTIAENNLGRRTADWTHGFEAEIASEQDGMTVREWVADEFDLDPESEEGEYTAYSILTDSTEEATRIPPSFEVHAGDSVFVTYRKIPVIDGFWNYTYVRNYGAAWSLFANKSESFRRPFFTIVSSVAIVLVLFILHGLDPKKRWLILALSLIVGGALGNLIDRVRYGYVVDFIDWYIVIGGTEKHWPTFNIADAWIAIGVGIMLLDSIFSPEEENSEIENLDNQKPEEENSLLKNSS